MKRCPFQPSPQRLPSLQTRAEKLFETVRRRAEGLLAASPRHDDGRRGLGVVHVARPCGEFSLLLHLWNWRSTEGGHLPSSLGDAVFADDPIGAEATHGLGRRFAAAKAFAEAANTAFGNPEVRFTAHPLEVVQADEGRPAGLLVEDGRDVLSMDLHAGLPARRIVDRLVADEHGGDLARAALMTTDVLLRYVIWQRAERLNAARAMIEPGLQRVEVPGLAMLRRRAIADHADLYAKRHGRAPRACWAVD